MSQLSKQPCSRLLLIDPEAPSSLYSLNQKADRHKGITVMKLPFTVGRLPVGKEPEPAVPIDLRISDSRPFRLSRQHFAFYQNLKGCGILELGSTLGTEVNGVFLGHNFGKDFEYLKLGENKIGIGKMTNDIGDIRPVLERHNKYYEEKS